MTKLFISGFFIIFIWSSSAVAELKDLHSELNSQIKYLNDCINRIEKKSHNEILVKNYCQCSVSKVFSTYSENTLNDLTKEKREDVFLMAGKSCIEQFKPKIPNIWTTQMKDQIKDECQTGLSNKLGYKISNLNLSKYCECYVNDFIKKYTVKEFSSWSTSELSQNMSTIIQSCQKETGINTN